MLECGLFSFVVRLLELVFVVCKILSKIDVFLKIVWKKIFSCVFIYSWLCSYNVPEKFSFVIFWYE